MLIHSLKPYVSALVDLFYPQRCVGCDQRASDLLCRVCFDALPRIGRPFCARCGMPTAFETFVCEGCKAVNFGFESTRAPPKYSGVGNEKVHALKYRGYTWLVERLATQLMFGVLDSQEHFDTVVPVPLHRSPLMRRGFNQVELLARGVAREIKAPFADTIQVARRMRDQVELSAAERWVNLSGALRAKDHICGTVLLVDDVFTTGATMSACAETLLPAGAVEVHALSLCRTC